MPGEASRRRLGRSEEEQDGYTGYKDCLQNAVHELMLLALSGVEIDSLLDEVVERVGETLGVEFCKVLELIDEERGLLLRAGKGFEAELINSYYVGLYLESQAGYTLISKEPVVVEDLRQPQPFGPNPLLTDRGVVSSMTAKIYCGGKPWGVIGAHTTQKRLFTDDEAGFLQDVANMLGEAIRRKRREAAEKEESVRLKDRYASLAELSALLVSAPDREAMLETTASYVLLSLADWCFIDLADEEAGTFGEIGSRLVWGKGIEDDPKRRELARQLGDRRNYPPPDSSHGTPRVLRTGKAELIPDVDDAVRASVVRGPRHLEVLERLGCVSYICVPVEVKDRRKAAIVVVSTRPRRRYDEADKAFAEDLATCAALAIRSSIEEMPASEQDRELDRPLAGNAPTTGSTRKTPSASSRKPPTAAGAPILSSRQREVLELMDQGRCTREIARALTLSPHTVESHKRVIYKQLHANTHPQALAKAHQLGLLPATSRPE